MDDQELTTELGIQDLTPEEQHNIIDALTMKIGEALAADLNEKQLEEFQAIIDGEDAVINDWLAANDPGYADTPAYQELAADSEGIPPEKLYAYSAWLQVNKPDFDDIVAQTKAEVKANLDLYR